MKAQKEREQNYVQINYGLHFWKISDGFYKRSLLKRAARVCDLTELQDRKKIFDLQFL